MMNNSLRFLGFGAAFLVGAFGLTDDCRAQDAAKPAAAGAIATAVTPELEAKFVATLTNATFKGRWSGFKDGQLGPEKEDSYNVVGITKVEGEKWTITARIKYGGQSIDLPIPAVVKWAGDTPVLVLDNVTFGGQRAYSARVMIYEKTYAGWWTAADHGGLLSGLISNEAK